MLWLQNYAASHPISVVRYKVSDMILQIHADSSQLSFRRAYIRSCGYHYLSDTSDDPPNNRSISTICKIVGNVMKSAAEEKIGSTYINAQDAIPLQTYLINMGNPQPPTNIKIYNTTVEAFYKVTLHQKILKSIDMCFYWLQNHKIQGQFNIFWRPGKDKIGVITKPSIITRATTA